MTEDISPFRSCPHCYSIKTKKDGLTAKGFQRFYCGECRKYWQSSYVRSSKFEKMRF